MKPQTSLRSSEQKLKKIRAFCSATRIVEKLNKSKNRKKERRTSDGRALTEVNKM